MTTECHKVETMAYANEKPWHGLGVQVDKATSVKDMIKKAGLTWKVEREPLTTVDGTPVPDFFALKRSSDDYILDVVGSRYKPSQIEDVFAFFHDFVREGKATMETAGSLDHGRYVWGLAKLNHDFTLPGKDKVMGYVLLACPFKQGKSLLMKSTSVRVVCWNTYSLSLRQEAGSSEFRMNHRNEFDASMIKRASETLGLAHDHIDQFEKDAKTLRGIKMTPKDTIKVLAPIYAPDIDLQAILKDFNENATPKLKKLIDINERAPGAQPDNAWGVFNAVTYYADHVASRTPDKRLTNAWVGKTATHKEKVLEALLERA